MDQQPMSQAPASSPAPSGQPAPKSAMHFDPKDVQENKLIACLSYIGILCLIPLLAKKDSKFAQEHGKQGLVLLIAWVCLWIVAIIPFLGWLIWLIGIFFLGICGLIAFIQCLMGNFWEIPLIGPLRSNFKL